MMRQAIEDWTLYGIFIIVWWCIFKGFVAAIFRLIDWGEDR